MEVLLPIASFVAVTAITPGPNNLLLAAASMRYGPRATIPHLAGIILGIGLMLWLCSAGFSVLLIGQPWLMASMRIGASIYLLYLAWRIIGFKMDSNLDGNSFSQPTRPMTVVQSICFQWVNPKAWMMTISSIGLVSPMMSSPQEAMGVIILCFSSIGLVCNGLWIFLGVTVRHYLHLAGVQRMVNRVLALLTLTTVGMFWLV